MKSLLRDMNVGNVRTLYSARPDVKYFIRKDGPNLFLIVEANRNNLRSKTARILTPQEWFQNGGHLTLRQTLDLINYRNTVAMPNSPHRKR